MHGMHAINAACAPWEGGGGIENPCAGDALSRRTQASGKRKMAKHNTIFAACSNGTEQNKDEPDEGRNSTGHTQRPVASGLNKKTRLLRVITPLQLETRFWGQNYLDVV